MTDTRITRNTLANSFKELMKDNETYRAIALRIKIFPKFQLRISVETAILTARVFIITFMTNTIW